ncbi:MAG: TrkH family potassium uptake protein [Pseudomonadota bacterium]
MVQIKPIVMTLGFILCIIAATMLLPAIVDFTIGNHTWFAFFFSSILTFFIGGLLLLFAYSDEPMQLGLKEGFVLTTTIWVLVVAFAAIPFYKMGLLYTDAFFEAMSGLTTTGSTVITSLDSQTHGVLLWRSLLQGLGGLGIVFTALIMLPFLRVGGMQLFQTESSDRSEKVLPRALELVTATAAIYAVLIVLCFGAYMAFGMKAFDAICHALTTVSTAGFSTHDESFGYFFVISPALEWVCIVFMILGALPFVVFIQMLRGEPAALWNDTQARGLVSLLLVICTIVTFWLMTAQNKTFSEAIRIATFNITSIVTTTGYSSGDYTAWGEFAVGLFFILMFVGGCSGSTSGGIKIYRLQIAGMLSRSHFMHLISPNRIITMTYNGRRLPEDVPFSVVAFLAIYMATVGFFTVVLSALGLDLVTSLSAAASALGNVGPGLGDTIGPAGNYSLLPVTAKWVLSFAMLLGRLELFTVLVLLRPEFWRS